MFVIDCSSRDEVLFRKAKFVANQALDILEKETARGATLGVGLLCAGNAVHRVQPMKTIQSVRDSQLLVTNMMMPKLHKQENSWFET